MPNSQWASITSNPLLTIVEESTVILAPMLQLGWRSASRAVIPASFSRGVVRKGPPEAVRIRRRAGVRSPTSDWKIAECSESTGRMGAPVREAVSMI